MKKLLIAFLLCLTPIFGNSQVTVENDPAKEYKKDLADRTFFEEINFSLQGPLHFMVPDTGFFGFIHPGMGSSIAIVEIPYRSSVNVSEEFASKDFEANNSKLISKESFQLENQEVGQLFKIHFVIQDQLVERLVLIIGSDKKTYMVYANYPAVVAPMISPVIKSSFKTCLFEE